MISKICIEIGSIFTYVNLAVYPSKLQKIVKIQEIQDKDVCLNFQINFKKTYISKKFNTLKLKS